MNSFKKIVQGEVEQHFEKNKNGKFVCVYQAFRCGDSVEYVDGYNNNITPPNYEYQPFVMIVCGYKNERRNIKTGSSKSVISGY